MSAFTFFDSAGFRAQVQGCIIFPHFANCNQFWQARRWASARLGCFLATVPHACDDLLHRSHYSGGFSIRPPHATYAHDGTCILEIPSHGIFDQHLTSLKDVMVWAIASLDRVHLD